MKRTMVRRPTAVPLSEAEARAADEALWERRGLLGRLSKLVVE